jgi:iron complex transport system ATP-binding protein
MSSDKRPQRILELRDASFSYERKGRSLIEGLGLGVGEADFVGLLGANGSGKSTILKLLAGILRPSRGEVNLWGKPLASLRNRDRAKLVSYLPQTLDTRVPFTAGELAAMGLYPYESPPGMSVEEALDMVGLGEKRDTPITQLSGGERRRAYIAMTLLQGAGILLLDEPLANLDIRFQMELMRLLRELNSGRGISILMALHDVNLAFQFDRLVLVKEGKVLGEGPPERVLERELLREAFEIDVNVHRLEEGSFITFGEGG